MECCHVLLTVLTNLLENVFLETGQQGASCLQHHCTEKKKQKHNSLLVNVTLHQFRKVL